MKKNLYKWIIAVGVIIAMYLIWPNPFWYLSRNIILPIGEKTADVGKMIFSPFKIFFSIDDLAKQNKQLEDENTALKSEIVAVKEKERFCSEVKKEVSAMSAFFSPDKLLGAKTSGRSPDSFNQVLVIDKGTKDGLSGGEAVTYAGALVGKVDKVYGNQSEVRLISSYNSATPVVMEKSREMGLVRGGIEGVVVTDIPSSSKIELGEKVLTSGLGGDLPQGILVGTIEAVIDSKGVFSSAKLELPTDLRKIEVLTVIKK